MTKWSAKGGARSSLHYGGEGVLIHPPHQGVCTRHGTEELCVTPGDLTWSAGGTAESEPPGRRCEPTRVPAVWTARAWRTSRSSGTSNWTGCIASCATLLALVARQVADGRVLRLIEAMLKAGSCDGWHYTPSERGTPQGGVVSPLLSNILLTPFDREMRERGYQLTRFADDWVVTCGSADQRSKRKRFLRPRRTSSASSGLSCIRRRHASFMCDSDSNSWDTKSSKARDRWTCPRTRFAAVYKMARSMRIRGIDRSSASWIRCGV